MQHSLTSSMKVFTLLMIGGFAAATVAAQEQGQPAKTDPSKVKPDNPPLMLTPSGPPSGAAVLTEQVIVAEPEVIELGEFSTTETKEAVVTLRNSSAEPVTIRSAKASCGCTTADFQRNTVLGPGETTDVKVRMRGGPTARKLNKTVTFTIDGYPQLRVPVQGESISFVKMTPEKLGIDRNPEGVIVLESIDEKPFKITRSTPDVLKVVPAEAANRHEVVVDWDKWWNSAENAKLTFYFEGHDRCNQFFTVVDLNREQRAEIQRRIREKRQSNGDKKSQKQAKKGETNVPAAPTRVADMSTLVRQGRHAELQKRLAEPNADVDEKDSSGVSLLGIAAKNGNSEALRILLEAGAEVDATDRVKRTALMHGGTSKNPKILMMLLENGADVNARDLVIGGPLAWSSAFGNADCVEVLVDAGAELETKGAATGYTPLIWSAAVGDSNSIPILVRAGADIEARDSVDGGTPLMHAAQTGKFAGMKALVEAKANVNAKDRNGKTALLRAAEHNGGTAEKIRLLLDNGAEIDVVSSSGQSALDLARVRSDANAVEVIQILEERMAASKK